MHRKPQKMEAIFSAVLILTKSEQISIISSIQLKAMSGRVGLCCDSERTRMLKASIKTQIPNVTREQSF